MVGKITEIPTRKSSGLGTSYGRERTLSVSLITSVYSTINVIITRKNMNTTRVGIARVVRARIVVVTIHRRVQTTLSRIAHVSRTLVKMVTLLFGDVNGNTKTVHARGVKTNV